MKQLFKPLALLGLLAIAASDLAAEPLRLNARLQVESAKGASDWRDESRRLEWDPAKTAIIICDMWDQHWCKGATARVAEMAPRMNEVVKAARARGVFIIHAPSGTLDFYKDHPGRALAQKAPTATPPVPLKNWCHLDPSKEAPLPIDDSDGGCDDEPQCQGGSPWKRQIATIEIAPGDAITDNAEAYNLLQQRGIDNVLVMGVHANMCVLGRPFSIRQMVGVGKNVLLMRDMTDTMYNSRMRPFVPHFAGTDLIVRHIERYWCPSVTSADLLGGQPFKFSKDVRPKVVCMIGEQEYDTAKTLPEFMRREIEPRGIDFAVVNVSETNPNDFPGMEALEGADLLVVSVRRRTPPKAQLELVRKHLAAGKPVVGIRTASHAFDAKLPDEAHAAWPAFDDEILGMDYQGHYGNKPPAGAHTLVWPKAGAAEHPILSGWPGKELRVTSHLYKNRNPAPSVSILLEGRVEDQQQVEPVAWVNQVGGSKVFYTSLGNVEDFDLPEFRRLLRNGILWSLNQRIPAEPRDFGSKWHLLKVPGTWEDNPLNPVGPYDGFAWYRAYVQVPGEWGGEDLELFVEQVDNAHAAYFNGALVGSAGGFPPNYANGLGFSGRHKIPKALVRSGANNLVAIRVFDNDGRGGFKGKAPELIWRNQGIQLAGNWEFRAGDETVWASEINHAHDAATFSQVGQREEPSDAPSSCPLSPAAAARTFTTPDDLEWVQVLSEPEVKQPVFINFDARGRLWVVQYIQYPDPAGLKMLSRDNVWRATYDKIPPAPPNHIRGLDKITLHEDTDGDGHYDLHKTFLEGLNIATSVAFGRGGVWVMNPPYLLFYPDANGDDIPDGDPVVHLAGFGLEDTHSVANSLRWGPDGWLYGAHGSTVTANIIRPGLDTVPHYSQGQMIWRYHPETRRYEVFAEGGGNAFGVEIDNQGRLFSGHNGGNTRGFHYVQGGYLQKGFNKHGPLSNPNAFGYFLPMAHPDVDRFTHTFIIYGGGALPARYDGRLFGVEPLQGRVVMSELLRDRSSFKTVDLGHPVTTTDRYFKPVDIRSGPGGAIYVADWYDRQVNHYRNHEGQIDKENGRVYRLQAKGATHSKPPNLETLSNAQLLAKLQSPNQWERQTALRLIGDRKPATLAAPLADLCRTSRGQTALEAFWALNLAGGFGEENAPAHLAHPEPQVRLWAVRLLGDRRELSAATAARLADLARGEPQVEVRSQLASSARRLPTPQALPILRALLEHDGDQADIHLPLLIWWAFEAKAPDRAEILALFADRSIWDRAIVQETVLERLMRRYAAAGAREDLAACARLLQLAPSADHARRLMAGFEAAYKGRSLAGLPDELAAAMRKAGVETLPFALRRGEPDSIRQALALLAKPGAPEREAVEIIQILGEVKVEESLQPLLALATGRDRPALQKAALAALKIHDAPGVAPKVFGAIPSMAADARTSALILLASRAAWATALVGAVEARQLAPSEIPADVVARVRALADEGLARRVALLWPGRAAAAPPGLEEKIARGKQVIRGGLGNPYEGQNLYNIACASCHKLFEMGGLIGPDLTTYNRGDLDTMLLNILHPNAEIREGYENYLLTTTDGRVLSGFLVDRDQQIVILRGIDGENTAVPKSQIAELKAAGASLMPEGLLESLEDQQLRDLFAYLRSTQPLVK